jgi:hypothetical protein
MIDFPVEYRRNFDTLTMFGDKPLYSTIGLEQSIWRFMHNIVE